MELNNRKNIIDNLKKYSCFSNEDDTIEITEWTNGEGWDISINGERNFSLSYDELRAINYLTMALDFENKK